MTALKGAAAAHAPQLRTPGLEVAKDAGQAPPIPPRPMAHLLVNAQIPAEVAPKPEPGRAPNDGATPGSCENAAHMGAATIVEMAPPGFGAPEAVSTISVCGAGQPARSAVAKAEGDPTAPGDAPSSADMEALQREGAGSAPKLSRARSLPSVAGMSAAKSGAGFVAPLDGAKLAPAADTALQPPAAASAQQANQPVPSAVPPPLTAPGPVSAPIATADSNRVIALRISRAIRSGEEALTVELHPAELGRIAVRLAFHGETVDVRMLVSRHETFRAFDQDRAALEREFKQAGIDLGGGGLDLRFSRTPDPEPWQPSNVASRAGDKVAPEVKIRSLVLGEGLLNIVA